MALPLPFFRLGWMLWCFFSAASSLRVLSHEQALMLLILKYVTLYLVKPCLKLFTIQSLKSWHLPKSTDKMFILHFFMKKLLQHIC